MKRNASIALGFLIVSLVIHCEPSLKAQTVTLNFEGLPGMENLPALYFPPGAQVPIASRLSDQFLASHGVSFQSGTNAAYVAVVNVPLIPSGTNAIGGVNNALGLDYKAPVDISFFVPGAGARPGVTDYVSIKGDDSPLGYGNVTLQAFDLYGVSLGFVTEVDDHPVVLTFSHPGIHRISLTGATGTVAYDDLTFSTPSAAELPFLAISLTNNISQVRVCWESQTNKMYQLQYRSVLTTNVWTDLGASIPGNDSVECVTDSTADSPKFYRVAVFPDSP